MSSQDADSSHTSSLPFWEVDGVLVVSCTATVQAATEEEAREVFEGMEAPGLCAYCAEQQQQGCVEVYELDGVPQATRAVKLK